MFLSAEIPTEIPTEKNRKNHSKNSEYILCDLISQMIG